MNDKDQLARYHAARANRSGGAVHAGIVAEDDPGAEQRAHAQDDERVPRVSDAGAQLKLADEIERACKAPNYEARLGTIEGKMVVSVLRQAASQGRERAAAIEECAKVIDGWLESYNDLEIVYRTSDDAHAADCMVQVAKEIRALSSPVKTGGEAEASNGGTTYSPIGRNADGIEVYKRDARPVDAGAAQASPASSVVEALQIAAGRIAGMGTAAARINLFGRLSEAYGAAEVEVKQLAKQIQSGEEIEDRNGIKHQFTGVSSLPSAPAQASRDVAIEECAKVAESFRRQMLPGDDRVLIRKIEDAIRSLSAVPSASSPAQALPDSAFEHIAEVASYGAKKLNEVDPGYVTPKVAGAINAAVERFWLIARTAKASPVSSAEGK